MIRSTFCVVGMSRYRASNSCGSRLLVIDSITMCGGSSDQWAMDLLWYQISPYKSHSLRGFLSVWALPLAVFANDHRRPVLSICRAGWRILELPRTLEQSNGQKDSRRNMKGAILLRTIVINEEVILKLNKSVCCQVSQTLRIFPAPFVAALTVMLCFSTTSTQQCYRPFICNIWRHNPLLVHFILYRRNHFEQKISVRNCSSPRTTPWRKRCCFRRNLKSQTFRRA